MKRLFTGMLFSIIGLAFVLSCGQKMTAEQLRTQALDFESNEYFEDAINAYEKLVKNYPENQFAAEALYKLGILYANNLKKFDESVQAYRKLLEKYPDSEWAVQSQFMIGYRYANDLKDLDQAKVEYEKFLEKYPDHELAASVKWELGHLGQDISDIEFLSQDAPGDSGKVK